MVLAACFMFWHRCRPVYTCNNSWSRTFDCGEINRRKIWPKLTCKYLNSLKFLNFMHTLTNITVFNKPLKKTQLYLNPWKRCILNIRSINQFVGWHIDGPTRKYQPSYVSKFHDNLQSQVTVIQLLQLSSWLTNELSKIHGFHWRHWKYYFCVVKNTTNTIPRYRSKIMPTLTVYFLCKSAKVKNFV